MRATLLAVVSLLVLVFARPARAADLTVSGPSRFVISDCASATFDLRFTAPRPPLAVRTGDIAAHDSRSQPVGWSLAWDKVSASDPTIHEYLAVGALKNGCPAAGSYTVPVVVTLPLAPEGGAPGAPADGAAPDSSSTATLSIVVVRAIDAVLDAPSAVTLATEAWPALGPDAGLSIPVRESSNVTPIRSLSATGSELKTSSGEPTGIELVPQAEPLALDAGAGAQLGLSLSNAAWPGTYTSRVIVHAPDAKRDQSIDVTLKVRLSVLFLFITIAVATGLGWWVNVWLAGRAALDAARLKGLRAAEDLVARATKERDPPVQQRIMGVAVHLETMSRAATSGDEVDKAIVDRQAEVKTIEEDARASEATLVKELSAVRGSLGLGGAGLDPAIADRVASVSQELVAVDAAHEAGRVEAALARLQVFEWRLPQGVFSALGPWLLAVGSALTDLGAWSAPEQEPEKTRVALRARAKTALALDKRAVLGTFVSEANALAIDLRSWIAFELPHDVAKSLQDAAAITRIGGRIEVADPLTECSAEALAQQSVGPDPIANLKALAKIRDRAEHELESSALPQVRRQIRDVLAKGDFASAAALLAPPPSALARSVPQPQAKSAGIRALLSEDGSPTVSPAKDVPLWPMVDLPLQLDVGKPTRATLDWGGAAAPHPKVTAWSVQPQGVAKISPDGEAATVTATVFGRLAVTAEFDDGTRASSRAFAGDVAMSPSYSAIARDAWWVNVVTGLVAAVLTTCVGYEIFAAAWFGTFADFLTAFLWGFFGQFGLDRIRTLAQPIVSKPLG